MTGSRCPIVEYANINVSTNPLEKRGLLHAQIEINGLAAHLHLVCLHLDLLERGRKQQMQSLIQHVRRDVPVQGSLIIAGDFNDWARKFTDPLGEELGVIESGVTFTGQHASTFPSWKPFLPLDRVYVRRFRIHDYQVLYGLPWRKMSDHAAVLVELELLEPISKTPHL